MSEALEDLIAQECGGIVPERIGVAVSGGGDSMALLHLLHGRLAQTDATIRVVTVDHGLRPEAASEASMVKDYCTSLGLEHDTLVWRDWDGSGNLQNEARTARYDLMADWAHAHQITVIVLGHTADDQAETVLMRMARRAGVDGLSGMPARMTRAGVTYVRPLLKAKRAALRGYLETHAIRWIEDPSNQDQKYDRIKARKILSTLAPLGIDVDGLSEIAQHMAQARKALKWQAFLAARDCVHVDAGTVMIEERVMRLLTIETQRRLLVGALGWITNNSYPPRRAGIAEIMQDLSSGKTLNGCKVQKVGAHIAIFRELNAVRDMSSPLHAIWDGRWTLSTDMPQPVENTLEVRALGAVGLRQCPDWRATGKPEAVLHASPAIWRGDTLVAAPLAGLSEGWRAQIVGGDDSFFASLLVQ